MTTYIDSNGEEVSGETPSQIVANLRDDSRFMSHQNLEDYMKGYAFRLEQISGIKLRTDSCENFVADLLKKKVLVVKP